MKEWRSDDGINWRETVNPQEKLKEIDSKWRDSTGEMDTGEVTWLIARVKELENGLISVGNSYSSCEPKEIDEYIKKVLKGSKPV